MNTLDEFEAEIVRLKALAPNDPWQAREALRGVSVQIRRMLWNNWGRAKSLAAEADAEASRIEGATEGMLPTGPEPRFPGFSSGGRWCPPVQ